MGSSTGARRAELECCVVEEDWQSGQSYMAHWHSVSLVPQDHCRLTATEAQHSAKHQEARRLLQRFLSGAISKNYPHSNTFSTRRAQQPTYDLSSTGPKLHQDTAHVWRRTCSETMSPESTVFETSNRKTVMNMTKLP